MRSSRIQRLALLAALLTAVTLGCQPSATAPGGRVLIVGIDGATLEVIEPLIRDGRLPHLGAIAAAGASGKLRSLHVLLSPCVWTSVATGTRPEVHGIEGWIEIPDGPRGEMRMYDSHDRRVHALWNIFNRHGRSVAIVNWLMTHPPEPVNGVMISDSLYPEEVGAKRTLSRTFAKAAGGSLRAPKPLRAPTTWPAEWAERALAERHREPLIPNPLPFASLEGESVEPLRSLSRMAERDSGLVSVALEIEAELGPDLMMVLLQGIDRVSHFTYGTIQDESDWAVEREGTDDGFRQLRAGLLAFYEYTDALIGRLLERYAEDDLVLVLSDHGFTAGENFPYGDHETEDARDGVLLARGRGIAPGTRAEAVGVFDITPSVLAWAGLPAGRDMVGRVASFLAVEPPATIASYEDEPIPRLTRTASGREAERIEELRALGYVE